MNPTPPRTVIAAVVAVVLLGGCSSTAKKTTAAATAAKATTTVKASPSVRKGIGASNASGDVTLGKFTPAKASKDTFAHILVKVTNHSSKASVYFVTVAAESADGKTQYDTTVVTVNSLKPGQSATADGAFLKKVPKGAKLSLAEVQRTAA